MSIHSKLTNLFETNTILLKKFSDDIYFIKSNIYKLLLDFIDINGEIEFINYFNKIIISFKSKKKYTIGTQILNSINSFLNIDDFILNIDIIQCGIAKNNIHDFYHELYIFITQKMALYVPLESEEIDERKKKPIKKKAISATMRKLVWNMNIGEEIGKSKCLCCKISDITQLSFHCGHIIPESNGGWTIVSNLRPICQNCNSSMGNKNMNEFMKTLL